MIAELTSITFTAKLQGIESRQGTRSANSALKCNLKHYTDIQRTSQTVRSDLTVKQQHRLIQRIISARKVKEIRTIAEGRGRKLKSSEYPELAAVLEYAFGQLDVASGGGGLEAHPRLTTGTLYRAADSATTMRKARETVLSLAPQGFSISLSACYNYTENYRKGTAQAQRHHFGKGVNAALCLKKPPRTGVEELVINLHWSTANVNHIIDRCQDVEHAVVISKDAKAIIPSDMAPVQHPGHSWRKRDELPDHTWDQSRTNAITPMTFLFLETKVTKTTVQNVEELDLQVSSNTTLHITRSGQGVTFLYLSFFEPDTTFKCMNELLLLVSLPALDKFFRNPSTGTLKSEFTFVVDNGPAEQPSSFLVQMCMVRLLRFLKLDKITQVSFAEYHSKRNFVERVHAEENRVLSAHGPFQSKSVHRQAAVGTNEHLENMEAMAEEVKKCISQATFGGNPLLCYRGVKADQLVFNDEDGLQNFLTLSEERKLESECLYRASMSPITDDLHMTWDLDLEFEGFYCNDYQLLQNELVEERTSWRDKYTTVLYSPSPSITCKRYEFQPIPDYIRWLRTCELHYLPLQERVLLDGPWDEIPALYLPTKILRICFEVMPSPPPNVKKLIALLAWVTPSNAAEFYGKIKAQQDSTLIADSERMKWKAHPLYAENTKSQLEALCRTLRIPVTPSVTKHQMVSLIAQRRGIPEPSSPPIYSGKLVNVPTTTAAISHMPVSELHAILKYHGVSFSGTKDQLVLKVFLLRQGRTAATTAREEEQVKDLIRLVQQLIFAQRNLQLTNHTYQQRTYTSTSCKHFIAVDGIRSESDLTNLFSPLIDYINKLRRDKEEQDQSTTVQLVQCNSGTADSAKREQISQIGSKVKIKWSKDEVGDSGWRPGWYNAEVQGYDNETDMITVQYPSEPGCTYTIELTPLLTQNTIKLVKAVI